MFLYFRGLQPNITKISLALEIAAAIRKRKITQSTFSLVFLVRIIMMSKPLSFYDWFSPLAESFLFGYSNNLSFMTDLLITFYW